MASLLVLSVIFLLLGGMAGDHQTTTTSWSNHNKRRLETSCSGICAVGFDVEFPTIVIVSGKTCQDLNDSKLHLMEGSEGCKKAKRLSSRCGCVPSATTTTTTTENEESDNTTTTVWSVQINNTSSTNNSRNNNGNKKAPYVSRFTEKQQAALKTTPHITGMLSLLGSIFVIQDIVRDPEKLKRTYSRLVLGVSIFDTFA